MFANLDQLRYSFDLGYGDGFRAAVLGFVPHFWLFGGRSRFGGEGGDGLYVIDCNRKAESDGHQGDLGDIRKVYIGCFDKRRDRLWVELVLRKAAPDIGIVS